MKKLNITKEEIERAYLALKKLIFYENNVLLHLKMQIVNFEDDNNFLDEEQRKKFFEEFATKLDNNDDFKEFMTEISFKKVIKKVVEKNKENALLDFIKRKEIETKNELEIEEIKKILLEEKLKTEIKYNYVIDCPIELHIISILWIFNEGYKLDKKVDKYSYGYRLNYDNSGKVNKCNVFKPYAQQYKLWRSKGIEKAKEIVDEDENVILINMDLKKFYYNINHQKLKDKIAELEKSTQEKNGILESNITKIIFKINEIFDSKVSHDQNRKEKADESIIPIGLYSSPILANFYLKDLDDDILNNYNPSYYGRYVDDIFIVFKEYKTNKLKVTKREYLRKKFSNLTDMVKLEKYGIEKSLNDKILSENDKQEVIFLDNNKKRSEIQKIENSFIETASTFAFLPNEKDIEKLYNKITVDNDEDFKSKKYDVSVYLAKILDIFSGIDKKENVNKIKETAKILLEFFDEENIIKYSVYYEKIFTFLVMGELSSEIEKLYTRWY